MDKKSFSTGSQILRFFICLFLILITLAAFWQVRNNEFINIDDDLYVTDNPYVCQGVTYQGIVWAFTSIYKGHWHPMTWLSHMLDYALYGLNPSGHHVTNLIFHVANSLLIFFLLQRMAGVSWRSGFVAVLFAIHPLHVESVAWVAERKDVLSAFFSLLAVWAYASYVQKPRSNRFLLVIIFFLLALMSKPMAVTLPFLLLLVDYWPLGRLKSTQGEDNQETSSSKWMNLVPRRVSLFRLLSEKIPLFLLAIVMSLFTMLAHRGSGALSSLDKLPLETRIGNAMVSYVNYITKMIWPDRLAVLYPHSIILPFWQVAGAALLLVIISVLLLLAGRKHQYCMVGWLWYLGALLPVIGLVQAGIQSMADRFTYLPMIGLFIIIVFGIVDSLMGWRYGRPVLVTSAALLIVALMITTVSQVQLWRDSITLFNHALRVTANNSVIHNNLGVTLARQGKEKEALVHYMKALEINPRYSDAHSNLATLLVRQRREQEAIPHFVDALRIRPDSAEAHNDLGVILAKQGKVQEAIAHFAQAVSINPNYLESYFNLGMALAQQGRNKEAISCFDEALRISPEDAKTHNNLAVALAAVERTDEAISHYRRALQNNPNNTDAHYNLGSLLALQGKDQEALPHFYEILRINPSDAPAHYKLGIILSRQGKNQEAAVHIAEVVRIIPKSGEAHLALGLLYLRTGKKDLALKQYKVLQAIDSKLAINLYQKLSNCDDEGRAKESEKVKAKGGND